MFSSQIKVFTSISEISALFNFEINHHSKTSITEEISSIFQVQFSQEFSLKKFHKPRKIFLSS